MLSLSLGFLIGCLAGCDWQQLPTWPVFFAIVVFALIVITVLYWQFSWARNYFLLGILAGFSWTYCYAVHELNTKLAPAIENKSIIVRGTIASIPEQLTNGQRFEFAVAGLDRVRLVWLQPSAKLTIGDNWQLQVRLKQPHATFNPGEFDYEAWLFVNNIRATGYVIFSSANQLITSHWYQHPLGRLRQYLAELITHCLNGNPFVGFITALVVGVRGGVTAAQWQVLRNTGTNHLIAIAGLHIGFVTAIVYGLTHFTWRRMGKLTLHIPAPQAAAVIALLAAILYSSLAGFSLPTQRALIMATAFFSSALLQKKIPALHGVALALLGILLLDPFVVLSASFWLSFVAIAIIIYGVSARLQADSFWRHWLKIQWFISLGLMPLTLYFFQQITWAGIIANIIAIPCIGLLVLPLSLVGTFALLINHAVGNFLLQLAAHTMVLIWWVLVKIAGWSALQWQLAINNYWLLICGLVAIVLVLAPRGIPGRWLAIIWVLPLFFWRPPPPNADEIGFTLLDVGQGLAAVVRTPHHVLVYDTGAKFGDNFDMGEAVVVPYLRNLGITKIDMLMISHGDNDHIGGANSVLAEMPVKQIVTSIPAYFLPRVVNKCVAGQKWQWDGVKFEVLYPLPNQIYSDNGSSCVLLVSNEKNSVLLTGDIEKKNEQWLLQQDPQLAHATVLVAPHHGSVTSSSPAFVRQIQPRYVLFPVGYLNRYHFPSKVVEGRYLQQGAILFNSADCGSIIFNIPKSNPLTSLECYRRSAGHFWNAKSSMMH